jgi:hypothetical protein
MDIWRRDDFRVSRFLNSQDLSRYSSFAPLTLLPILVSLIVLPITINTLGISTWQSIITGQGVGLILAEVVDGGWVTLGPKIMKDESTISIKYRLSIFERFPRLVICIVLGLFLIQISGLDNKFLVSLSFLCWVTNGFNVHWISIATGVARYTRNYVVIPRILGQIVGIWFLVTLNSSIGYLGCQLLFSIAPIVISFFVLAREKETISSDNELPERKVTIILGNLFKSSSTWIIIIVGSALFDTSFAGYAAIFRFLDILTALSLVINQSNHSSHIGSDDNIESRNRYLHSLTFSAILFLISFATWPVVERIIFVNQTGVTFLPAFAILVSIPLRTLLSLYTQDRLIVRGKAVAVFLINAIQPLFFALLMWVLRQLDTTLFLVPYFFIIVLTAILIVLWIIDMRFRDFVSFLTTKLVTND